MKTFKSEMETALIVTIDPESKEIQGVWLHVRDGNQEFDVTSLMSEQNKRRLIAEFEELVDHDSDELKVYESHSGSVTIEDLCRNCEEVLPEDRLDEREPANEYCSEKCYEDRPLGTGV